VRWPQTRGRRGRRRRRAALNHDFDLLPFPLPFQFPLNRCFPLPLGRLLSCPLRRNFTLNSQASPLGFDENIGTAASADRAMEKQ
jgi:hypothetical protein